MNVKLDYLNKYLPFLDSHLVGFINGFNIPDTPLISFMIS